MIVNEFTLDKKNLLMSCFARDMLKCAKEHGKEKAILTTKISGFEVFEELRAADSSQEILCEKIMYIDCHTTLFKTANYSFLVNKGKVCAMLKRNSYLDGNESLLERLIYSAKRAHIDAPVSI